MMQCDTLRDRRGMPAYQLEVNFTKDWPTPRPMAAPEPLKHPRPRRYADTSSLQEAVQKANVEDLRFLLLSIHAEPLQIAWALDHRDFAIMIIKNYLPKPEITPKSFPDRAYDLIIWLGQRLP